MSFLGRRDSERLRWFLANRRNLGCCLETGEQTPGRLLPTIPSKERLVRVLRRLLDESEFLSPHGVRALSRLFGGNSNWRGPVWMPVSYLLIEALERYHRFYGDTLHVECPTGSGRLATLGEAALDLSSRLAGLFLPDSEGRRPCHGDEPRFARDPHWRGLVLFHEYFHGDTVRGLGASHQTGWTALVAQFLENLASAKRWR